MSSYQAIKEKLAKGWNTWNTRSVLSHVLLPECFAINLAFKEYEGGNYLKEALIGRFGKDDEKIHPGMHAYDGSYTELRLQWRGTEFLIQSGTQGEDLVLLVTPVKNQKRPVTLVIETGILWNGKGILAQEGGRITGSFPGKSFSVYVTKETIREPNVPTQAPYLAVSTDQPAGISTGKRRSVDEIMEILRQNKREHTRRKERFGDLAEVYNALQSCMAWDTIYEPGGERVVTTVSRLWNISWGGYILFCWDTYFAALMASVDNRELAYANAIEITREKTERGFVPNYSAATGVKSRDRSQPPVGSLVVRELYRKYGDRWLLEELFDDLYSWNTWFLEHREVEEGLMAWGSDPFEPAFGNYWETAGINDTYGAALESGLDNSPMYDGIPFDTGRHILKLADAGLTGLYIADCMALADIADALGKTAEAEILRDRAARFGEGMKRLWDEENGLFYNKRTDTGEFNRRISPTNFYPLLSGLISQEQADRMIREHFYNPEEFWGEWILPSISRNDPAYPDQNYWRGRIWAPMNFLVYLGLCRANQPHARKDLARKSKDLILKEWLAHGHVHENYCGDTGEGCNKDNSDKFYHWGALLALIALMEEGYEKQ